jgi:four helix bundle protein
LALAAYLATKGFPAEERFGLTSQIRRAAVSSAANLVEGCARTTEKDYVHFLTISLGSASETMYLLGLAQRLGYLSQPKCKLLESKYAELLRSLQNLITSIEKPKRPASPGVSRTKRKPANGSSSIERDV